MASAVTISYLMAAIPFFLINPQFGSSLEKIGRKSESLSKPNVGNMKGVVSNFVLSRVIHLSLHLTEFWPKDLREKSVARLLGKVSS